VDLVNNSATKEQLDTAITTIWDDLGGISKRCFPPFSPKTKYVSRWSPKLNTVRKQVNALKRRVKRCKNSDLREIYGTPFKDLKHRYKTKILTAKQNSWKKFCTDVKSTPWKIHKMCKEGFARHPIPSSLTLPDGSISRSAKETANAMLHKFFPDDPVEQDSVQQRNSREKALGSEPPDSHATPDFRNHEVEDVIRKLQDKKCPGPDGIDGVIVKRIHKILSTFWATIFNKCFLLGCFPKVWKEASVIAIPKTDKSKLHTVQGYRGSSLLSIPGESLEKLVIGRLNYFLETIGKIPPQQYGFTVGRSTADAIKTVIEFVSVSRKQGTKCCLLALDISGAFDNAWHPGILARLRELKCPPNIYSVLREFLQDRYAHIRLGDVTSAKRVTRGCPQGSVSGPTLWNIIISDLTVLISKTPNLKMVTFADDILLMIRAPPIRLFSQRCKEHSAQ
jgi:hypothetical protein